MSDYWNFLRNFIKRMYNCFGRAYDRFMDWPRWGKLASIVAVLGFLIGTPFIILDYTKEDNPTIVLVLSAPPATATTTAEDFSPTTPPEILPTNPSTPVPTTSVMTTITTTTPSTETTTIEDPAIYLKTQRTSLEYFYNMTNGDYWKTKTNWLDPKRPDVCTWYGIACDINTGFVREIKFKDGSLNGAIPSELGLITSLESLRFHGHDLSNEDGNGQSLPSELSQLTNLKHVQFSTCRLQGTFPPSYGSSLTSLEVLDLRWNNIESGIPNSIAIGMSKNLRKFLFRYNNLRFEIPTVFGQLTKLQELDLFAIQDLTGTIPTELGLLDELEVLNLGGTDLSGDVPKELINNNVFMTNLRELSLPESIIVSESICQNTNISICYPEPSLCSSCCTSC